MEENNKQSNTRRLHIGGEENIPGWEVLNVIPGSHVDHLGNANDLSRFEENTFIEIYASHIVEHLDFADEMISALLEWHRVLSPGGKVYVSVPDMDILAELFLMKDQFSAKERFSVMVMMFGGHVNEYDYHYIGLNQEFLTEYLELAGFINIKRVENFGFFDDTSTMSFNGVPISLNVIAEKSKNEI